MVLRLIQTEFPLQEVGGAVAGFDREQVLPGRYPLAGILEGYRPITRIVLSRSRVAGRSVGPRRLRAKLHANVAFARGQIRHRERLSPLDDFASDNHARRNPIAAATPGDQACHECRQQNAVAHWKPLHEEMTPESEASFDESSH